MARRTGGTRCGHTCAHPTGACAWSACRRTAPTPMPTRRSGAGRAEATANTCFGTKAAVREAVEAFFDWPAQRTTQVQRRCRTALQAQAATLQQEVAAILQASQHVDFTVALV